MGDVQIEKREESMSHFERVWCSVCVFSGDLPETDSDAAAEALRAAGFEVYRLPPAVKATVEADGEPGDDFIEIRRGDRSRAGMESDAEDIVEQFGGRVELGMESLADVWMPDEGAPKPPPPPKSNVVRLAGRRKERAA
jgi:hypothetical protein